MLRRKMGTQKGVPVVALAGNPNAGKSTLFNAVTGLKQHTGNWPGKTVEVKWGTYRYRGKARLLVDLPGTYSLLPNSLDEGLACEFLLFGHPEVTVVVIDATCLARSLTLALQILELTPRVVVCVNLVDEAERRHLEIDVRALAQELGVPVVATAAATGRGISELLEAVDGVLTGSISPQPPPVYYGEEMEAAIAALLPRVEAAVGGYASARWLALRLLAGDGEALARLRFGGKGAPPASGLRRIRRAQLELGSQPR